MDDTQNKIIEKVQKLLKLAESTTYGAEAESAMLQAQRLMAENHLSEYQVTEQPKSNVIEERMDIGIRNASWRLALSKIIADNFRCKTYYTNAIKGRYGTIITFLGEEQDARIALSVFHAAQYTALLRFRDYRKENDIHDLNDPHGSNSRNGFLRGFVSGLRMKFEEQKNSNAEWGLVLATPQSVIDRYVEMKIRTVKCKQPACCDDEAYGAGFDEGRNFDPEGRVLQAV